MSVDTHVCVMMCAYGAHTYAPRHGTVSVNRPPLTPTIPAVTLSGKHLTAAGLVFAVCPAEDAVRSAQANMSSSQLAEGLPSHGAHGSPRPRHRLLVPLLEILGNRRCSGLRPTLLSLPCRAEMVLGNIIKKKGWR